MFMVKGFLINILTHFPLNRTKCTICVAQSGHLKCEDTSVKHKHNFLLTFKLIDLQVIVFKVFTNSWYTFKLIIGEIQLQQR